MKIQLRNAALSTLAEIISLDGWAKGHKLFYQAGHFLAEVLPAQEAPVLTSGSTKAEIQELRTWQNADAPEFELTELDAEMCRNAIEKLTEAERLRPSKWTYQVQVALKPETV